MVTVSKKAKMLLQIPQDCEVQEKINEIWFFEIGKKRKIYFDDVLDDLAADQSKLYCYLDGQMQLSLTKKCAIVSQ